MFVVVLALLVACEPSPFDDDPATACNESNEACGPGECALGSATMLPGSDCMGCHYAGSPLQEQAAQPKHGEMGPFPLFTIAGTVFSDLDGTTTVEGAIVRVTDAEGTEIELETNAAGNFFCEDPIVAPYTAEVELGGETVAMASAREGGSCNSCHQCDGVAGGKLTAP